MPRKNSHLVFIKENLHSYLENANGIISLNLTNKTTRNIADFYKDAPFPNYDGFETKHDLLRISNDNKFVKDLKKNIGLGKKVIEVGSGTSQLSLALAAGTNNFVVAMDPTIQSLKLGSDFADKNVIENVTFLKADIFDDPCEEGFFDCVWCSGVLHHTHDAKKGFKIITKWVRPDGLIIIGLYNKIGRLRTNFRQLIYFLTGKNNFSRKLICLLDPYLRKNLSYEKQRAWFLDQYEHPLESKHTIDEVLSWFDECDVQFLGSVPGTDLENTSVPIAQMDGHRGSWIERIAAQVMMLFSPYGAEGGLFLMVGKKK